MDKKGLVQTRYTKFALMAIVPITLICIPSVLVTGAIVIKFVQDISEIIIFLPGFMTVFFVGVAFFYFYDFLPNYKNIEIQNTGIVIKHILCKKSYDWDNICAMDSGNLHNLHFGDYGFLSIEVDKKIIFFDSRYIIGLGAIFNELGNKGVPVKSLAHWKSETFKVKHVLFLLAPFLFFIFYKIIVVTLITDKGLTKDDFVISTIVFTLLMLVMIYRHNNIFKVNRNRK